MNRNRRNDEGRANSVKTAWDEFVQEQMQDPKVRASCQEESRLLSIGIELARLRKSRGLTQAQLAQTMGTSTPQLSRTERRPENATMRTLMRFADAMGMEIEFKLVAKR